MCCWAKYRTRKVGRNKKKKFSLVDVGSGAGFPGLVIALMCQKISNVSVVDKIKNDLNIYPSKHLAEYELSNLTDYEKIEFNNFDSRRKYNLIYKNNFDKKDNINVQNGYLLYQGFFDFKNGFLYQTAIQPTSKLEEFKY